MGVGVFGPVVGVGVGVLVGVAVGLKVPETVMFRFRVADSMSVPLPNTAIFASLFLLVISGSMNTAIVDWGVVTPTARN